MVTHTIGRKGWILICVVWLITQLITLYYYGIYTKEEAGVYLNIADEIVKGNFHHSVHYFLYGGYILPLVILKYLGLSVKFMYLLQLILSFAGLFAFVSILQFNRLSRVPILAGGLLFASCPFFHSWNSHIYTDAYFGNLVVIYCYLLLKFGKAPYPYFIYLICLLIFITCIRPVGFLLIIITLIYLLIIRAKGIRLIMVATCLLTSSVFIGYALKNGKDFFYPNHNLELNVICGLSSNLKKYEKTPHIKGMSIQKYFLSNPGLSFHLFSKRLGKSLWMTRPYFSQMHNTVNGFLCLLYYITASFGIFYVLWKKLRVGYYFISGMVIWLVPNVLLCADWHNRFMVPLMPFLMVLAAFGLEYIREIGKWNVSNKKV